MARFELRLSDVELELLRDDAWRARLSVSEYARRVLFPPELDAVPRSGVLVGEAPAAVPVPARLPPEKPAVGRREVSPNLKGMR